MKRVPDRKKMRRDYLRRKGKAYAAMVGGAALLLMLVVRWVQNGLRTFTHDLPALFQSLPVVGKVGLVLLSGASIWYMVTVVVLGLKALQVAKQVASQLPHVPPVTPSILPSEEILVRSAAEPSAPTETLLRATVTG